MDTDTVEVMNKMSLGEHMKMYYSFFFEKGEKFPKGQLPQESLDPAEIIDGSADGLKTSWLGHSSLLIAVDGYTIMTDPLFERKVSPVGPTRFNKELPLNKEDIPDLDAVIISHDHYDHLNKYSVRLIAEKTAVFVVPDGVGERLVKWGIPEEKVRELSWWQEFEVAPDLTITATPSQHFSGRGLFDRNKTLWASWVIRTDRHNLFFSGDSGYFDGFKTIGEKYGPFDVAFMECGAYNTHWSNVHMFPEQTVRASLDLGVKVLHPIHWATFNLALHPWYEPMERLVAEAWRANVTITTPVMGSVVDYTSRVSADLWWYPAMEKSRSLRKENQLASVQKVQPQLSE